MNIGFAMCGSFCTYSQVFPIMEQLAKEHNVIPIFSTAACNVDCRFGTAEAHFRKATDICGTAPLHTIEQVEPIGPKKLLDALIIAPCTGNTLAKLAHSIADGPVTMAAKSHLRNGRPIIIAVSTNDALAGAAENIGRLLSSPGRQADSAYTIMKGGAAPLLHSIHYSASASSSQTLPEASLGMIQAPRGPSPTEPTVTPSGTQLRLNCWVKNRR